MRKISFIVLFLLLICIPFSLSATLQKQPEQVITENTSRLVASPVTIDRTVTSFPWGESFEGATWPPTDWVVIESASLNAVAQNTSNNHTAGGSACLEFSSYYSAADYTEYARTPEMDLTGVTAPMLKFWFKKSGNNPETLYVDVNSNSDVTTYTNWTQLNLTTDWTSYEMDLTPYVGQNVYVGFKYYGAYQYYVYLDDVEIYDTAAGPSCCSTYAPAEGTTDVLEYGFLGWSTAANADRYTVYMGSSTGNYNIINGATVTSTSYPYSGLTYGSTYYYKVVPGDGTAQATGCPEISFTVRNDPSITTFPWMEDFASWPPTNWDLTGGSQSWSQFTNTNPVECAKANFWGWQVPNDAYMTSPPVQIPSTGSWTFAFDWSHLYDSSYPDDQGICEISTDGNNWTELWNLTGSAFDSQDGAGSTAPGTYANESFSMASYLGQTVIFRFHAISGYGPDFFIDNVQVLNTATPPACASVQSPADGETDVLEFGTLSWSQPLGAESYDVYMGTSSGNYDIVNGTTITSTAISYDGLNYGATYYWKVVPGNQHGSATGCPEWTFSTRADPTVSTFPHVVDFTNAPNWIILAGTGTWTLTSSSITGGPTADHTSGTGNYALFADGNPSGTVNQSSLQTTPFDVTGLSNPTLQFWYWIGTTDSTDPQSTLYLDIYNGSTWIEGASSYTLNGQWQQISVDLTTYSSASTTFRFRAEGTTADMSSIGIDDFVVLDAGTAPSCVTAASPTDTETNVLDYGTLVWTSDPGAEYYNLYLGNASGSYNIVNGMTITSTMYDYSGLSYSSTYYWMVVPGNSIGDATGCPEWTFTTRADPTIIGQWSTTFDVGIPANWYNGTEDLDNFGAYTSSIGHGATADHSGTGTYLGFDDSGIDGVADNAYLYTNPFDFRGLGNPSLSFWYWIGDAGDTTNDQSTLYLDTYDGSTWTTYATSWGHTGDWTEAVIDLSAYTDVTTFRFRAEGTTSYYSDVCIDDFMIVDAGSAPGCVATFTPTDAQTNLNLSGTLIWDATGNTDNYTLYFGTSSGTYDIVNGMTMTSTNYAYSGLSYSATYYWKVVPGNIYGDATGCPEWTFTIMADPTVVSYPWLEEFTNWSPAGWTFSGDRTWAQYNSEMAYCNFWGWNGGTAIMTTPAVVLPSTGFYEVHFDWSHHYDSSYPNDQGIVQISTDGTNWTELWNITGSAFESSDGAGSTNAGTGVTESYPLDAYLGQTVYFQIIGNSGYGPDFYLDNFGVQAYTPPTAKAKVNVYLGGPYSTENHNMETVLNQFLPTTSPYTDAVSVTAMPTDVVDWISVELRQTNAGATIEQRSALLLDTGMIVDVAYETDNTVDYISFNTAAAGDYFVVVRHRNHIDIMSAAAATLPADPATATAVDFTTDAANAFTTGPNAVYEVETGIYAMYPGDVDGNGAILSNDATLWANAFTAGVSDGYHLEDIDLDSSVIAGDNVAWKVQFAAGAPDSQIPDNSGTAASSFSRSINKASFNRNIQRVNKTLKVGK